MINIAQFNWLDYLFAILILVSIILGFQQGFFKGLVAVIIWLLALLVPMLFADNIAVYLVKIIPSISWAYFVSFILLMIVTLIISSALYYGIQAITQFGGNIAGSFFGAVFGFIRGILLVTLFVAIFSPINFSQFQWFARSQLVNFSQNILNNIQQHTNIMNKKMRKKMS